MFSFFLTQICVRKIHTAVISQKCHHVILIYLLWKFCSLPIFINLCSIVVLILYLSGLFSIQNNLYWKKKCWLHIAYEHNEELKRILMFCLNIFYYFIVQKTVYVQFFSKKFVKLAQIIKTLKIKTSASK